jgi:uncharacterized membrane protein YfcA
LRRISAVFLLAVFVVGFISGTTAALIGFGIGSLLTPLLLARLEPHVAVAAVALPHLIATAVRHLQHRGFIDRAVLLRFGLPAVLGGIAGAALQKTLRSPILVAIVGVLLISTGIANLTRGFAGCHPRSGLAVVLGFLSGVFGGLAGNQGGLRAAGLTAFNLQPRALLATSTAVALLIDLARTPVYLTRGATDLIGLAAPILVATLGCVLGTVYGERLFLRIHPDRYRIVIGAAVLILGVSLLASAFRAAEPSARFSGHQQRGCGFVFTLTVERSADEGSDPRRRI